MNVQPNLHMDKAAFLAWVNGREERFELARGRVLMMTAGSRAHGQITANLFRALDARLDPNEWTILSDFGVDVGPETLRYPDIVVDRATEGPRDLVATAPALIAEVLSPSTERLDLGDKAAEYLRLGSLTAYLVLAQDELKGWIWVRGPDGFAPGPLVYTTPEDVIRIAPLGIDLPLAEIYVRVKMG
jgi:Uma2 family endonuclease